jgi:hypothetical protein
MLAISREESHTGVVTIMKLMELLCSIKGIGIMANGRMTKLNLTPMMLLEKSLQYYQLLRNLLPRCQAAMIPKMYMPQDHLVLLHHHLQLQHLSRDLSQMYLMLHFLHRRELRLLHHQPTIQTPKLINWL